MDKISSCYHSLGFFEENGYDGAIITNFVSYNEENLPSLEDLKKLQTTNGAVYDFCPHCGKELKGVISKVTDKIQKMIKTAELKKKKEDEKRKIKRDKDVEKLIIELGLARLERNKNYIFIEYSTNSWDQRKHYRGSSVFEYASAVLKEREYGDKKILSEIFEMPSTEQIDNAFKAKGYNKKEGLYILIENIIKENSELVSSKETTVYISGPAAYFTIRTEGSCGDVHRDFVAVSLTRLGEHLGADFHLQKVSYGASLQ